MKCIFFSSYEDLFISPLLLRNIFAWYRFLGWQFFSLDTLSNVQCLVFYEFLEICSNSICFPVYNRSLFSDCFQDFCFWGFQQCGYSLPWHDFPWVYLFWFWWHFWICEFMSFNKCDIVLVTVSSSTFSSLYFSLLLLEFQWQILDILIFSHGLFVL